MTDQMSLLRRLRREGQITDREFDHVSANLGVDSGQDRAPEGHEVEPGPEAESTVTANGRFRQPKLRTDLTAAHTGTLVVIGIILLMASALGMLSWLATVTVILVSLTTIVEGWEKVTLIGALIAGGLTIGSMVLPLAEAPVDPVANVPATTPAQDPSPPVEGSLGISVAQVTDAWNSVDTDPRILKGLTLHNETGEYDTFIYRFGEWGRVAGAFDPAGEAIHALLVTGQLSNAATDQLYLHLCFLVEPYSQDCIDSYHEQGLEGGSLADFSDADHQAEWILGDNTWRLQIEGNVLTIRVFAPDAVP